MPDDNSFPSPTTRHPVALADGSTHKGTVFLAAVVQHPRFHVGDYTYASAHNPPTDWAAHLAPYLYDFSSESLSIGKFCQIADGVQLITASANHRYDGISSYPFAIFGGGSAAGRPSLPQTAGPDTWIGHDVWIGQGARILPGAQIGNGVIIGAGAVVSGSVPSYSIIAGNPAQVLRRRFAQSKVDLIERIAWWDWPIKDILKHESLISGGDSKALARVADLA